MNALVKAGLIMLGLAGVAALFAYMYMASVPQWRSALGAMTGQIPDGLKVAGITLYWVAPGGGILGLLLLIAGVLQTPSANPGAAASQGSKRVLITGTKDSSASVILCKNCKAIFTADNKGRKCDHCGAIL